MSSNTESHRRRQFNPTHEEASPLFMQEEGEDQNFSARMDEVKLAQAYKLRWGASKEEHNS